MADARPSPRSGGRLPWTLLLVAALAGVVARLAFGLGYWTGEPLTRDEQEYLSLARSLAAGEGFVYDPVLTAAAIEPFGRAPGYPAFLALTGGGRYAATEVPDAIKIAQSIAGGLGVLMVGMFAGRLAGPRASVAAASMAAVYPPLVWIAGYALSEALFWPIGLAVAYLFDRVLRTPGRQAPALLCGLALGAGVLIRPALILFLPLAGAVLLMHRRVLAPLALTVGLLVVVGPWTARNYAHHGRLVFVASEGGVTFWTGNHPLATGDGDMAANMAIKLDNQRLRAEHAGISEEDLEPIYYREAIAWIRAHPLDWIALEFRKLFYLVVPAGPSYTLHSTRYYVASVISYGAVLALAIFAATRGSTRLAATPGLWILAASAILMALVFFPQERFRIPILDPSLVILAGAGVSAFRPFRRA
jgi:4-amino-4-deoxy-L-arabinose transferase-like glycosyltransferase